MDTESIDSGNEKLRKNEQKPFMKDLRLEPKQFLLIGVFEIEHRHNPPFKLCIAIAQ